MTLAPLNIAICEDLISDQNLLQNLLENSGFSCQCDVFASGLGLLEAFKPGKYDLIFLDIYMEGMKGVEAAAEIRKTDPMVTLAFTTTSTAHTLESYRLKAISYLEKPVGQEDINELLALVTAKREHVPHISLLIEGVKQRLPLADILYFEQINHAVFVHTQGGSLRTSQTVKLKDIEALLPSNFLRCHHSFIANLNYVRGLDKELKVFDMQNGDKVYIRHASFSKSIQAYEDFLFKKLREAKR